MPADRQPERHPERGLASVVALVILMPLLFLFVWLGVQAAVAARTNQVAAHAAQEGTRAARDRNGSLAAGRAEAWRILRTLSPGVLRDPRVQVSGDEVTVGDQLAACARRSNLLDQRLVPLAVEDDDRDVVDASTERIRDPADIFG